MAANKLFCRSLIKTNQAEIEVEPDIDEFILTELNHLWVLPISVNELTLILKVNYIELLWKIVIYLTILKRSANMIIKKFNIFQIRLLSLKSKLITSYNKIVKMYQYTI